ncbi:MAG: DUF72 domain-containing protein [Chloroflexota bacterium]|nr:DUF72 domain-containing protein [Chloroflexota bacterium]
MPLLIGTSGWQYRHWRETFYPRGVAQSRWLEFYAERFTTVESNAAFYRLPEASTFAAWAERTPPDFIMAVKASRYLTHIRRLREPDDAVEMFVERASRLGSKLGPVLLQLPPTMRADVDRLRATLRAFPREWRVAVEFRHRSWYTDEVRRLLQDHQTALCLADRRGPLTPIWRTADWTYLRFHTGRASPEPCYGRRALATWIERIGEQWKAADDVFVYFNNDPRACALRDARLFALAARRASLRPTRIPGSREVRLG